MARILGVIGRPRRHGNTHLMVSRILDAAQAAGAAVEPVFLADLAIQECDGCHGCWKTGRCAKRDDMCELYPRIGESDAIVFGTPVYWYGPTSIMKAFLDRFVFFNCPSNRDMIRGRAAVLAIPYEEQAAETAEPLIRMFELSFRYLEISLAGCIVAPGAGEKGDVLQQANVLADCDSAGVRLARAASNSGPAGLP